MPNLVHICLDFSLQGATESDESQNDRVQRGKLTWQRAGDLAPNQRTLMHAKTSRGFNACVASISECCATLCSLEGTSPQKCLKVCTWQRRGFCLGEAFKEE